MQSRRIIYLSRGETQSDGPNGPVMRRAGHKPG
nr:MAG TPA: hypothetical protein [Caudoviricetes sp.]